MIEDEAENDISVEPETESPDIDQRYLVPGLARGLALLQLFSRDKPRMKLSEIAAAAGLSRSAAFRLLYTLEKEHYLQRDRTTGYGLTSKILSLGFVYLNSLPLTEIVQPCLRRLSIATDAAAHLTQLDGTFTVYLARVAPAATLVSNLQVGRRLPAHATASGRVLLSGLDETTLAMLHMQMRREHPDVPPPPLKQLVKRAQEDRARGYVMGESVFDPGVVSFAAPIRDGTGAIIAAVNVVGPRSVMEKIGDGIAFDAVVGQAARELSAAIGFVP